MAKWQKAHWCPECGHGWHWTITAHVCPKCGEYPQKDGWCSGAILHRLFRKPLIKPKKEQQHGA